MSQVDNSQSAAVAPPWHTVLLLGVLLTISAAGAVSRGSAATRNFPHPGYYAYVIAMEAALLALCLWKVNWGFRVYLARVVTVRAGLWPDVGVALLLLVFYIFVLQLLLRLLLGFNGWQSLQDIKPTDRYQLVLWLGMSTVAGICEEIVFRGYLLQQFGAWMRSLPLGTLAQAVAFGLAHGYQGWKNMVLIAALGYLLGIATVFRRSLRTGIIAHVALDSLSAFF